MSNPPAAAEKPQRILFLWWGRRGAMARLMLDLCKVALQSAAIHPLLSVSRSNALIAEFRDCGATVLEVDTFSSSLGAVVNAWTIPKLRSMLAAFLVRERVDAVVVLMSHVWTPLVASAVTRLGIPYVVIVHDGVSHPGDRTARVLRWLERDMKFADTIVTLSHAVAKSLLARGLKNPARLKVLFLPDFASAPASDRAARARVRLLFLGRIMSYKGLPLFVEAIEHLRARGVPFEASVVGEGNLEAYRTRLIGCGVTINNAWQTDAAIDHALATHDVVVLTHIEASQSGVAALALGAGLPLVVTPVGGLCEQVEHGRTGLIAARTDGVSVADALERLLADPTLLTTIREGIAASRTDRSMQRFVEKLAEICYSVLPRIQPNAGQVHGAGVDVPLGLTTPGRSQNARE